MDCQPYFHDFTSFSCFCIYVILLYTDVPDQVRPPSQVGNEKISKGGWTIAELLSHVRNITLVFVLNVIERGFSPTVRIGLARLGVFLQILRKEEF